MSNQPIYRRPRSHAYSCRCARCIPRGDFVARNGILGPGFLILCAVVLIGFWPAMVWHGYTDTGGWRWDIRSTIAEAVYFGIFAFIALLYWADHRAPLRAPAGTPRLPEGRVPPSAALAPPAAPACRHLHAAEVENLLYPAEPPWAYLCPECKRQLPGEFGDLMRPCCGTKPGRGHRGNCPHAARWHELNDLHRKG